MSTGTWTAAASPPGLIRQQLPVLAGGPGLSAELLKRCLQVALGKESWLHVAPTSPPRGPLHLLRGRVAKMEGDGTSQPGALPTSFFPRSPLPCSPRTLAEPPGTQPAPGGGLGSSREQSFCPMAPGSWVIGFHPWVDIAWGTTGHGDQGGGLRSGAIWSPGCFSENFPNPKWWVWSVEAFTTRVQFCDPANTYVSSRLPGSPRPQNPRPPHWLHSHSRRYPPGQ